MPPGWRLEELSSDLKDVDFLEFAQAFVAVASESTKIKAGDFAALGEHEFSLARGLNFAAEIELDKTQASPLAKTLYAVLGRQGFLLSGSVGPRATDDSFSASLPSADIRIPIPPWDGVHAASELVLGQPAITIRPAPLFVAVSGHIEIPVKRGKDIDLQGAVAIGVDQLDISGNLDVSSLAPPSDAQGVELDNVGLSMGVAPEGVTAAFVGDMLVGKARSDDEFSFELAFPEFDPVFLYARFTGVNLGPFFKALCKDGDLPSAFSKGVRFDDILLYWCGDQGGCRLPDKQQTLLQTGFAIHGRVRHGVHPDRVLPGRPRSVRDQSPRATDYRGHCPPSAVASAQRPLCYGYGPHDGSGQYRGGQWRAAHCAVETGAPARGLPAHSRAARHRTWNGMQHCSEGRPRQPPPYPHHHAGS